MSRMSLSPLPSPDSPAARSTVGPPVFEARNLTKVYNMGEVSCCPRASILSFSRRGSSFFLVPRAAEVSPQYSGGLDAPKAGRSLSRLTNSPVLMTPLSPVTAASTSASSQFYNPSRPTAGKRRPLRDFHATRWIRRSADLSIADRRHHFPSRHRGASTANALLTSPNGRVLLCDEPTGIDACYRHRRNRSHRA
jgi:hypothetical protein